MAKIELGRVGAVIYPSEGQAPAAEAAAREAQGFPTIWITGGPLAGLDHLAQVVRGTERARVAPGILAVVRFDSDAVAALYAEMEAEHPGRFVVGLGGAHGPSPRSTPTWTGSTRPASRPRGGCWPPSGRACSTWPGTGPPERFPCT